MQEEAVLGVRSLFADAGGVGARPVAEVGYRGPITQITPVYKLEDGDYKMQYLLAQLLLLVHTVASCSHCH
ncbi:hypothetical protein V500_06533 [Pseudogymnoascus sp. VKM F-4518 (FW-2643)]|nr:hypothetical protein V500_06533 [Pseudogymnoascus sp. VKM F-4518 (FW-2643)]